jgi:hypothetical protein
MSRKSLVRVVVSLCILVGGGTAWGEPADQEIKLEHGRFDPAELVVPANTPFKVRVTNADTAAIEFESFELHRERVVQPGETITVYIPPLASGSYPFFDDFHRDTPPGAIVAQ